MNSSSKSYHHYLTTRANSRPPSLRHQCLTWRSYLRSTIWPSPRWWISSRPSYRRRLTLSSAISISMMSTQSALISSWTCPTVSRPRRPTWLRKNKLRRWSEKLLNCTLRIQILHRQQVRMEVWMIMMILCTASSTWGTALALGSLIKSIRTTKHTTSWWCRSRNSTRN